MITTNLKFHKGKSEVIKIGERYDDFPRSNLFCITGHELNKGLIAFNSWMSFDGTIEINGLTTQYMFLAIAVNIKKLNIFTLVHQRIR